MKPELTSALRHVADTGEALSADRALDVLNASADDIAEIFAASNALRVKKFGNKLQLCSIVNAKSGSCGEDCKFCAQSAHYKGCKPKIYDLLPKEELMDAYGDAAENPISYFGVVTSGGALKDRHIDLICEAIREKKIDGVNWCASLGCLKVEQLTKLRNAGLKRFHHNLETAESFFPNICTTHSYQERLETVKAAKSVGLQVCCGGLLGMGETKKQRVEFAQTLQQENVDTIPLNFLMAVDGTPMEGNDPLKPVEILKTLAMFKLINPNAGLKIAAGRPHLRSLQSMIFMAGCNGMMIGDLLTLSGGDVTDDLQMVADLNLGTVNE